MSYGYNQQGGGGGYGQRNPYDQRDDYGNGGGYGGNQGGYGGQGGGYGNNVEMQPVGNSYGQTQSDPNAILNECQAIDRGIDEIDRKLEGLQRLQRQFVQSDDRNSKAQLEREGQEIMDAYRTMADRVKRVKSRPDSGNPRNAPQVGRVDRRVKQSIRDYQNIESKFRREVQDAQARQYRIVNPNATEEEVREAVEDTNTQIFQQALLRSNRHGQAQSTLSAVKARHEAIQNIERSMIELAQLFQDLDAIVVQQEETVMKIDESGEQVQENVTKANVEINGAIDKARARNRKKWWCVAIIIAILIVIAIIVAVVVVVMNNNKKDNNDQ